MSAPRLGDQLCFQLYTASRLVTRAYRPVLKELGISYPQYLVLLVLWEARDRGEGAPTVKALGKRLFLDSGTLTPLLKRIEALGFVTRTRDARDERSVRITLTDKGAGLASRASDVPKQLLCEATAQDVARLMALRDAVKMLVRELS